MSDNDRKAVSDFVKSKQGGAGIEPTKLNTESSTRDVMSRFLSFKEMVDAVRK